MKIFTRDVSLVIFSQYHLFIAIMWWLKERDEQVLRRHENQGQSLRDTTLIIVTFNMEKREDKYDFSQFKTQS